MNWYEASILIIVLLIIYSYWSFKKAYFYFEKNCIPYIKPCSLYRHMIDALLRRKTLVQIYAQLYRELHSHRFGGMYLIKNRAILLRDPELIKTVLIKDFEYFHDRGINMNREMERVSINLFNMKGEEWKNLRIKLNTTFTIGKMKMMLPLVNECGKKLYTVINNISAEQPFDIKDLAARFTTDVIATCGFGLDVNSLENPNSEFRKMGKKLFEFRFQNTLRFLWPTIPAKLIKLFNLSLFNLHVQNFFKDIVEKTIKYREDNKISRNDFLDLLIALKNNTITENFQDHDQIENLVQIGDKRVKSNIEMTTELLASQCIIFYGAGFETSSTTLAYLLLELAQNEIIQNKAREEILSILDRNHHQLTYETIKQMTYIDMVIAETLRKHPPAGFILRQCNRDYEIPNTEIIIPSETIVVISIQGIHSDERYYDNPDEFRPERFTEEEKAKRPRLAYLPFGDGPRVCIGEQFAKMQIKIGLIYMLKNFSYRPSPKMKFPLEYENSFLVQTICNGIWLQRGKC